MSKPVQAVFGERFIDQFAGSMIKDPETAITELIANAWDAYATNVVIDWPDEDQYFSIEDNGKGLSKSDFMRIWKEVSYDRTATQGEYSSPPADLPSRPARKVFGRNGKGRLSGFYFGDAYTVETWQNGEGVTFEVTRDSTFNIRQKSTFVREGHGFRLSVENTRRIESNADLIRQMIANRFLFDPEFNVTVNGTKVNFDDLPESRVVERELDLPSGHKIRAIVLDSAAAHESTRTHGISWWVNRRAVGKISWIWPPAESLLDGRRTEAKRYTILLIADCMAAAVREDWSGFNTGHETWLTNGPLIRDFVDDILDDLGANERRDTFEKAVRASKPELEKLSEADRSRWASAFDQLLEKCPSLSDTEITQVMNMLATMEVAESQYSLLTQLSQLSPDEIDATSAIFDTWTAHSAKLVLDEIETRLKLVSEIGRLTEDTSSDEVHDLQPLFKRGLWIFGPEFDSIEYTSNQTMATVIQKLFGKHSTGSRNRPDFVATPDSSLGFYSTPAFDEDHAEIGCRSLAIVELKKPSVAIGDSELGQVWKYVKELLEKDVITHATKVHCHVLGRKIADFEGEPISKGQNGHVTIRPMLYSTFVARGESRLFALRSKIRESREALGADGSTKVDEVLGQTLL